MEYITSTGAELRLLRIDRSILDNYAGSNPAPLPPMRDVQVFGGEIEQLAIANDPEYLAAMRVYHMRIAAQRIEMIAAGVTIEKEASAQEAEELAFLGASLSISDRLKYSVCASRLELLAIVELVFYLSTVTQRGIDEAAERFAVSFMEKPVLAWKAGTTNAASQGALFEQWGAALELGYNWSDFCKLGGAEQSAIVAYVRIKSRLDYLLKTY